MLAVLGLLIIPGLPVALCVRARGVIRLGVAIIVSVAVIAAASLIAPVIGLGWSLLPVLLVAVIVSLVAVALRRVGRGSGDRSIGTASKWVWGAVILAFCGWTTVVAFGVGGADHPNQLYDGLFHLNAVEFILQNSDASPLHMTMVAPDTSSGFYPTLWHAIVSLVVPASGSVVAATNVVSVAVVGLIWPVAVASLTSAVFPARPNAAAGAALASFGFSVFPLGFLNWGGCCIRIFSEQCWRRCSSQSSSLLDAPRSLGAAGCSGSWSCSPPSERPDSRIRRLCSEASLSSPRSSSCGYGSRPAERLWASESCCSPFWASVCSS